MPLKRLELKGFKSFADRTEFVFEPGITAIVGPNGSGKSNIADAIRWVLGEQSARPLRGNKMEDVIFAGSSQRKPVGMAEVSITLDNSRGIFPVEYGEITITRRVFRSGESEFFLNRTPCRLKDIHDLLADTGIGREGYSLVGQGKINQILHSRPEERRAIIEEAAGIVKYRQRKEEAVKKLAETEQNLVRLRDIISELEWQLQPLKEQAEKAREYQKLAAELRELETTLAAGRYRDLKQKKEQLEAEISSHLALLGEKGARVNELQQKIVSSLQELKKEEEEIELLKEKVYTGKQEAEKRAGEIRLIQEKLHHLTEEKKRIAREIVELQAKTAKVQEEETLLQGELEKTNRQIQAEEKKLAELRKQQEEIQATVSDLTGQLEELRGDYIEFLHQEASLRNEEKMLREEEGRLERRLENVAARKAQILRQLREKEGLLQEKKRELKELAGAREKAGKQLLSIFEEISFLNEQLQQEEKKKEELQTKYQQAHSRYCLLTEMEKGKEGYQRGVRNVLQAGSQLSGIHGTVAGLLEVPPRYAAAIAAALGNSLQFVVVENEEAAQRAIEFLKKSDGGRATFLPLQVLQPTPPGEWEKKALSLPGVIGRAADLVATETRFDLVREYLLGRIIVVEDLDKAIAVAQSTRFRVRLVTLEGDFISPGGVISGGSRLRDSEGLLTRKNEIKQLQGILADLEKELREVELTKNRLTVEKERREKEKENLTRKISQLQEREIAGEKEAEALAKEKKRLQEEAEYLTLEEKQLTQEKEACRQRRQELLLAKENRQGNEKDILAQEKEIKQKIEVYQRHAKTLAEQIAGRRIKIASLKEREEGLRQRLSGLEKEKREIANALTTSEKSTAEIVSLHNKLEAELQELKQTATALLEEVAHDEKTLQAKLVALGEKREKKERVEKALQEAREQLTALKDEVQQREIEKARVEMEIDTLLSRLQEEFNRGKEELEQVSLPAKLDPIRSRLQEVRAAITRLGRVNLGAIEEYQRVNERYVFLCEQEKDLEEAKKGLARLIDEIEEVMVERFTSTFAKVNSYFGEIFQELFNGGHAELKMTDSDNVLTTGIEIIARPPGKKPQHLSLLSGGEKALTAIALLFALLKVKPSPFCLLDEIEASLDEANVSRFAAFLRRLASDIQFIVISHRKGTMEVADALYGITMEEDGVSRVVSVKLAEDRTSAAS